MKRPETSDTDGDSEASQDQKSILSKLDEDAELSFHEEVLCIAKRWKMTPQPTNHHELTVSMYVSDIKNALDNWNGEQIYPEEDPERRLIGILQNIIAGWEKNASEPTENLTEQCVTDIEQAINRKQDRIKFEQTPTDNVTLLLERRDSDIVGGKILDQRNSSSDTKISRNHENLFDYTEIRHTTREEAETLLEENNIDTKY